MENLKQVNSSHYNFTRYCKKPRWNSFWHQIDEILAIKPESFLEIGPGPGILGVILKYLNINYQSLDIDPELNPSIVGSATNIPLADNTIDLVGCFQMLEHLEYPNFLLALKEIYRVSIKGAVISLPDAKTVYPISIQIPKLGKKHFFFKRPRTNRKHVFDGEHHWEINKAETPIKKVENDILNSGFKIEKTYRVPENPYHRFYILKK